MILVQRETETNLNFRDTTSEKVNYFFVQIMILKFSLFSQLHFDKKVTHNPLFFSINDIGQAQFFHIIK